MSESVIPAANLVLPPCLYIVFKVISMNKPVVITTGLHLGHDSNLLINSKTLTR